MKLVDANVLLYAVNDTDAKHGLSRQWLDDALGGTEVIGFSWVVLLGFLRLSTKVGVFPAPLDPVAAMRRVDAWTTAPAGVIVEPTSRHRGVLAALLAGTGTGGNLVTDAHLAALAVEYDATVVTFDHDFGRFTGVRWQMPG